MAYKCTKCGHKEEEFKLECPNCGSQMGEEEEASDEEEKKDDAKDKVDYDKGEQVL